jgi:hypothetical protein
MFLKLNFCFSSLSAPFLLWDKYKNKLAVLINETGDAYIRLLHDECRRQIILNPRVALLCLVFRRGGGFMLVVYSFAVFAVSDYFPEERKHALGPSCVCIYI